MGLFSGLFRSRDKPQNRQAGSGYSFYMGGSLAGKADKSKSTEKIDGAIAIIMALDRAIRCGNDASESVYDSRGLLWI